MVVIVAGVLRLVGIALPVEGNQRVLLKVVVNNNFDQHLAVNIAGGITGFSQALGPSFVIGRGEFEKKGIVGAVFQEI